MILIRFNLCTYFINVDGTIRPIMKNLFFSEQVTEERVGPFSRLLQKSR